MSFGHGNFVFTQANLNSRKVQSGDTEQYVGIIDMICEGPIRGLVNGKRSVFLDNVPFEDAKNIPSPSNITSATNIVPTLAVTQGGTTGVGDGYTFTSDDVGKFLVIEINNQQFTGSQITQSTAPLSKTLSVALNSGTSNVLTGTFNNNLIYAKLSNSANVGTDTLALEGELSINTSTHVHTLSTQVAPTSITIDTSKSHTLRLYAGYKIAAVNTDTNTITIDTSSNSYSSSWPQNTGSWAFSVQGAAPVEKAERGPGAASFNNIKKVEASTLQFRRGTESQIPFADINGVAGGISTAGTGGNTPLKQPATLPAEVVSLGFSYGNWNSGRGAYDTFGYPKGQSFADNSGSEVVIPALASGGGLGFGLTSAQISQADEVNIRITYPALYTVNTENADKESAHAHYIFQIKTSLNSENSDWKTLFSQHGGVVIHSGKTTAPTSFDHTIGLARFKPFDNFQIRIVRLTRPSGMPVWADGTAGGRTDLDKWQMQAVSAINGGGLSATIKDKLSYPHTSASAITFSSKDFSNLPQRSYLLEGLKVRIPSSYTPREYTTNGVAQYSGFWNGTFKEDLYYTDNPAWIFYDIITNQRYGAGKWISAGDINKYALYRIAQYCDELVDDGNGGTEPRFRANFYLAKATEMFKVLKDMASMFTGMLYWMDGKLNVVQDLPSEPVYTFTKSNVINGIFNYEGTSRKNRTNQVIVTWNDPTANYEPVNLIVEDREAIVREGRIINESAVAMGATSEGQAIRYGRWKVWTAQNQKEIVSFETGLQGAYIRPGDVINVQDADKFGIELSGRVSSSTNPTSNTITLDRPIELSSGTYTLSTLVESYAAFYAGLDTISVNGVSYSKGARITGQLYVAGSLATIDSEEKASSAQTSGGAPVPLVWKPYTYVQENTVSTSAGTGITTLTTSSNFGVTPKTKSIWALTRIVGGAEVLGSSKKYRVLAVSQNAEGNTFSINAVEYYVEKYNAVDKDYALGVVDGGVYSPNEDSEAAVPAPNNLFVILETDAKQPGEEIRVEWEKPQEEYTADDDSTQTRDYEFFAGYEFIHNIPNSPSPMLTEQTSIRFDNVPDGIYTFRVKTLSNKGNSSEFISTQYEVEDPYGTNVARMQGGIVKGGTSNVPLNINANTQVAFEVSPSVFASLGDPLTTRNISNNYSLTSLAPSTSYYVYVGSNLTLVYWDELSLRNLPFWREIPVSSSHLSSQASKWTSLGSVSLPKNSNTLTGSGFNNSLALRDVISFGEEVFPYKSISDVSVSGSTVTISTNSTSGSEDPHGLTDGDRVLIKGVTDLEDRYFYVDVQNSYNFTIYDDYDSATGTFSNPASNFTASNLTSYSSGGTFQQIHADAAIVTAIISNTEARLDRAFDHAISTTAYRSDFRPDYQQHAIVAEVSRTLSSGSYTYSLTSFLVIDPDLQGTRELVVDTNVSSLSYQSDETQYTPTYSNITIEATGLNYQAPEFKITGTGFNSTSGSEDSAFVTGTDGRYTKQIHNSSTIAWNNGTSLEFTVEVREKHDPLNTTKIRTKTLRIFKTKDGSIGLSGKSAKLLAEDYTILYDTEGKNPSHTERTISAWGISADDKIHFNLMYSNFTTPIYKLTKTVGGSSTVVQDWTDTFSGGGSAIGGGEYLLSYKFPVPTTYSQSDYPVVMQVEVGEKPSSWSSGTAPTAIEGTDSISVIGVRDGAGGVVLHMSNSAHTYATDKNGNVGTGTTGVIVGSASFFEVLIGGKTGDYVGYPTAYGSSTSDSALAENQWYIVSAANTGGDLTISPPTSVDSNNKVTIGSHTAINSSHSSGNPTDDVEVITYTVKAKVGGEVQTVETQQTLTKSIAGIDGASTIEMFLLTSSASAPSSRPEVTYTFASGAIAATSGESLNSWSNAASSVTATNRYLWKVSKRVVPSGLEATVNIGTTSGDTAWEGPVLAATFGDVGEDGRTIALNPTNGHVINYTTAGAESTTIAFTAEAYGVNSSNTAYYKWFIGGVLHIDGTGQASPSGGTSNSASFTLPDSSEPAIGNSVKVTVELWEGTSASNATERAQDSVTIYAVQDGQDAITGFLTNNNHSVQADNDGTNYSLTLPAAGGTFEVYKGGSLLSSGVTFSGNSTSNGLSIAINSSTGAYTLSGNSWTTNAVTFDLTATVTAAAAGTANNVVITQVYSITKSLKGVDGQDGQSVTGPAGLYGLRQKTGYVYFQQATTTKPQVPTAQDYSFTQQAFVGLQGQWAETAPTFTAGATNQYWYASWNAAEARNANGGPAGDTTRDASGQQSEQGSLSFGQDTYNGVGFTGLVTFTDLQQQGSTQINGANITTGTINAARINLQSQYHQVGQLNNDSGYQTNAYFQSSQISALGFQTTALTSVNTQQVQGYQAPPSDVSQLNDAQSLTLTTGQKQQITQAVTDVSGLNTLLNTGQTVAVAFSQSYVGAGKIVLQTQGLILTTQAYQVQSQSTIVMDTTQGNNRIQIYDSGTERVRLGKL